MTIEEGLRGRWPSTSGLVLSAGKHLRLRLYNHSEDIDRHSDSVAVLSFVILSENRSPRQWNVKEMGRKYCNIFTFPLSSRRTRPHR